MINVFVNEICKVLHWKIKGDNSSTYDEEYSFKDDLTAKKYDECNIALKTISFDDVNKLKFANLDVSSVRNKTEILAMHVKTKQILVI